MNPSEQARATQLVDRARGGDRAAWNELADRYTNLLWSIARGLGLSHADAADAVQMTWLRLVERIDTVRQPEQLASWLATTMRRECLAVLRHNARVRVGAPEDLAEDLAGVADADSAMDDALVRQERDAALWRAVGKLGRACRALLRVLMSDPPPSYAEVSRALDMPLGSIGPTRQRCLRQLREILRAGTGTGTSAAEG